MYCCTVHADRSSPSKMVFTTGAGTVAIESELNRAPLISHTAAISKQRSALGMSGVTAKPGQRCCDAVCTYMYEEHDIGTVDLVTTRYDLQP